MTWLLLSLIPCVASFNGCQMPISSHSGNMISNVEMSNAQKPENISKKCVKNPKIDTFMYHYIRNHEINDSIMLKSLSVPPEIFEQQMQAVAELQKADKIQLMTGEEFLQAMKNHCFPHEKIFMFTADDGWSDNFYALAPIAEKYQIPFIFGIVSGTTKMHNFVTEGQIKALSDNALFTIASHSVTHSPLDYWSLQKAKSEICDSKKHLENIIWKKIHFFIYPYGKIGKNSIRFVKECGYSAAWSTNLGKFLDWESPNVYNMNRINVGSNLSGDFFEKRAEK